jgi:hypothetical protein
MSLHEKKKKVWQCIRCAVNPEKSVALAAFPIRMQHLGSGKKPQSKEEREI